MSLTEKSQSILRAAGWFPGRRVSLEPYESVIRRPDGSIDPTAAAFLTEFGGLHVRHAGYRNYIHFDPVDAAECMDVAPDYEEVAGQPLTTVGLSDAWSTLMLMTPTGRLYGLLEDLRDYGEPAEEGLNNFFENRVLRILSRPPVQFVTGLTPGARTMLERAGWNEGRRVAVDSELQLLSRAYGEVPDTVRSFLESFAGLQVEYQDWENKPRTLVFSVSEAVAGCSTLVGRGFGLWRGVRIFPVGVIHSRSDAVAGCDAEPGSGSGQQQGVRVSSESAVRARGDWFLWVETDGAVFMSLTGEGMFFLAGRDYFGGLSTILENRRLEGWG